MTGASGETLCWRWERGGCKGCSAERRLRWFKRYTECSLVRAMQSFSDAVLNTLAAMMPSTATGDELRRLAKLFGVERGNTEAPILTHAAPRETA